MPNMTDGQLKIGGFWSLTVFPPFCLLIIAGAGAALLLYWNKALVGAHTKKIRERKEKH